MRLATILALVALLGRLQEGEDRRRIEEWVGQLAADEIDVRDQAYRALVAAREKALPALRMAAESPEIEVRESARSALAKILWNMKREPIEIVLDAPKGIRMHFLRVEAGMFRMGDTGNSGAAPHEVTISKDYWLQTTEVTQDQWMAVMGTNPSRFSKGTDLPVESISWEDCKEFLSKLNKMAQAQLGTKRAGFPTEAEWEYACRAGERGKWCFGDDGSRLTDYGWSGSNAGGWTHPVALKKANAWGFFDMHGNVWEWCEDWHGPYERNPVRDPKGPREGLARCVRGGSWVLNEAVTGSAGRSMYGPQNRSAYIGLRAALH